MWALPPTARALAVVQPPDRAVSASSIRFPALNALPVNVPKFPSGWPCPPTPEPEVYVATRGMDDLMSVGRVVTIDTGTGSRGNAHHRGLAGGEVPCRCRMARRSIRDVALRLACGVHEATRPTWRFSTTPLRRPGRWFRPRAGATSSSRAPTACSSRQQFTADTVGACAPRAAAASRRRRPAAAQFLVMPPRDAVFGPSGRDGDDPDSGAPAEGRDVAVQNVPAGSRRGADYVGGKAGSDRRR